MWAIHKYMEASWKSNQQHPRAYAEGGLKDRVEESSERADPVRSDW